MSNSKPNTLLVTELRAYGKTWYQPVNNTARLFATLIKQKSFTAEDIARIKPLGYKILVEKKEL